MAANVERGELDVNIGGEERTLRFQTAEVLLLEKQLGKDPLQYISESGGQTTFLVSAIYAGLSRGGTNRKLTPMRVANWLDVYDGDRVQLQREIMLAIARGRPGDEGKQTVQTLLEAFGMDKPDENGERPSSAG